MSNTNCLEGMACPQCGSLGPFTIEIKTTVVMHDDGSELGRGHEQWDGDSYCGCRECDTHGVVSDFRTTE